jgi:hypothetical protein
MNAERIQIPDLTHVTFAKGCHWLDFDEVDPATLDPNAPGAHCALEFVNRHILKQPREEDNHACPAIARLTTSINDRIEDDDKRTETIRARIEAIVNADVSPEVTRRRGFRCLDLYIRTIVPLWLELVPALKPDADALRALPEIVDDETAAHCASAVRKAVVNARAAWSAAWSAAESAAESAAYSAAESAAWSAARSAALSAAESAAESAAYSAAWSAAWSAAYSAALSAALSAAYSAAYSAAWSAAVDEVCGLILDAIEEELAA